MRQTPCAPFTLVKEFKLVQWFIQIKVTQGANTDYFRNFLSSSEFSCRSGSTFYAKHEEMLTCFGRMSWENFKLELGETKFHTLIVIQWCVWNIFQSIGLIRIFW